MNPRITTKIAQSKTKLHDLDNKVNDMYTDGIANGFPPEILGYTVIYIYSSPSKRPYIYILYIWFCLQKRSKEWWLQLLCHGSLDVKLEGNSQVTLRMNGQVRILLPTGFSLPSNKNLRKAEALRSVFDVCKKAQLP